MWNQPAVVGPDGVSRPYIGGQALLEGVMMRSPRAFAAVLRRRDGSLLLREKAMVDPRAGRRAWPLVRGVVTLVEALRLGAAALRFSAKIYEEDLDREERARRAPAEGARGTSILVTLSLPVVALVTAEPDGPGPGLPAAEERGAKKGEAGRTAPDGPGPGLPAAEERGAKKGEAGRTAFTVLTIVIALALFVALPQAFAEGTSRVFGLGLDVRAPLFQVLTGAAKIAIVVGYMLAIRRLPEIRRMFQYHGAEHKAIHTYEAGEDLVVERAREKTTLHPRCGTTFLVMLALVSVLVFTAIGPLLPPIGLGKLVDNVALFLMKLPLLPVIAAITFEIQRFFARHCTRGPARVLLWPGFLVQKITTLEPDAAQLETALAALRAALARELGAGPADEAGRGAAGDRSFESFESLARELRLAA